MCSPHYGPAALQLPQAMMSDSLGPSPNAAAAAAVSSWCQAIGILVEDELFSDCWLLGAISDAILRKQRESASPSTHLPAAAAPAPPGRAPRSLRHRIHDYTTVQEVFIACIAFL